MNDVIILKTNILGGFDRQQTVDCIAEIKAEIEKCDCREETSAVKGQVRDLNTEINLKEREIDELLAKLNALNSPEAKAQAAAQYLRSISAANLQTLLKNNAVKEVYGNLIDTVSKNSENADRIFSKLTTVTDTLQKLSSDLAIVSKKLDSVSFDENTPVKTAVIEETEPIDEEKVEETPIIIEDTAEETQEEFEPMFENSVDNFFAELEKLMNK